MAIPITKEYLQQRRLLSLFPTEVININDQGEEEQLYAFADNHGTIFKKEEIIHILEKALKFYNQEDSAEWLEKENLENNFHLWKGYHNSFLQMPKLENGKYSLPLPDFKKKEFTKNRAWSITCGWCGNKISNKEFSHYYTLNNQVIGLDMERACSDDCATHIWKERARDFIVSKGYKQYFDMESLNLI